MALPTSGQIELTYDAFSTPGPTADLLIDVTGYYVVAGTGAGSAGPAGATGPAGPAGPPGPAGEPAFDTEGIVHVARNGTPDGSNGAFDTVQAALNGITDASAQNRYVIEIGPGTFEGRVIARSHVTLQGAGVGDTVLTWTGGSNLASSTASTTPTLDIASVQGFGVRDLTVRSAAALLQSAHTNAVRVLNAEDVRLTRVETIATGGSSTNLSILANSSVHLTDVRASASGGSISNGIELDGASATLSRVWVTASGAGSVNRGMFVRRSADVHAELVTARAAGVSGSRAGIVNSGSTLRLHDSRVEGATYSMFGQGDPSGGPVSLVASSQLIGPVITLGLTCVGAYNGAYQTLGATCE